MLVLAALWVVVVVFAVRHKQRSITPKVDKDKRRRRPGRPDPMSDAEVLVVGGGIAGASVAAELALEHSVLLLEREQDLGRHATGRSAATFVETLGDAEIRALTRASRRFLEEPPDGFGPSPLSPMALLYLGRRGSGDGGLQALYDEVRAEVPDVELLDGAQTQDACGYPPARVAEGGLYEPRAMEVDVAGLHQGFVRALRSRGGEVLRARALAQAAYDEGRWVVTDTKGERHRPRVVVDAAGAWCDEVAACCGVQPIGIQPLRRTVFTVPAGAVEPKAWPMVVDAGETFYAKPEAGQFLCSPMDETPEPPGEPRPEELDIARAMAALDEATTLAPRRVLTAWAGLRSFAPDRLPGRGPGTGPARLLLVRRAGRGRRADLAGAVPGGGGGPRRA